MLLSEFEKNEILKYLREYKNKKNKPKIDLFEKGQIFSHLSKVDKEINPKLGKKKDYFEDISECEIETEKEVIIQKEIIKEKISEDKIREIIDIVKSEITNKDKKEVLAINKVVDALKLDPDFIAKVRTRPIYGSGYGYNDVVRVIDQIRPLNPKLFGEDDNGMFRIIQVGDKLIQEYKVAGIWIPQCECEATEVYDNVILTQTVYTIEEDSLPIIAEDGTFLVQE